MRVKAKAIPKKELSTEDLIAEFCYYYQQYKFHEARQLPHRRIIQMLQVARSERAKNYFELVNIVSAPHSKKGSSIKKLQSYYKEQSKK
jgi:hypothetical protein